MGKEHYHNASSSVKDDTTEKDNDITSLCMCGINLHKGENFGWTGFLLLFMATATSVQWHK